jgi:hypothetical protein
MFLVVHARRYFLWFSGAFLAFSAILKLLTLVANDPIVRVLDPVWGIQNRILFLISSAVELAVCLLVLAIPQSRLCTAVVATLGAEFVLYHLFGLGMGARSPCPCLGGLSSWFQAFLAFCGGNVPRTAVDNLTATVIWFAALILLSGGIAFHRVGPHVASSAAPRV